MKFTKAAAVAVMSSLLLSTWWKIPVGNVVISNGFTFEELESRNGKVYIELMSGVVTSSNGDGREISPRGKQNYVKYPKKFKKGTKMKSIVIYNPKTNYTDDIVFNYDYKED